jgi:hypothetical protein
LGDAVYTKFPLKAGMSPMGDDLIELVLNRTWRPQLAVTGIDGLPPPVDAGNVLLPSTVAKLSLRLPPTLASAKAGDIVRKLLEKDPPYGARVLATQAPWAMAACLRDLRRRHGLPLPTAPSWRLRSSRIEAGGRHEAAQAGYRLDDRLGSSRPALA